jgi:hypothetical protein
MRALQSLIIQLRVSPPFERPHVEGLLAQVSFQRMPSTVEAQIRARPYHSMDWLEVEPGNELKLVQPVPVDPSRAQGLLSRVAEISLPLLSPSLLGIHETSYQLKLFSGASGCEFNWWHTPPTEWRVLEEIVSEIESIAGEALRGA